MQVQKQMTDICVKVHKCPVPIIWLDTSVIINIALLKLGKLNNVTEKLRIEKYQKKIYELTRIGKLLCPEASQPNEVWVQRSNFLDTLYELSLGVTFRSHNGIKDLQVQRMMSAYISGETSVTMPYIEAFLQDPVLVTSQSLESGLSVHVDMGILGEIEDIKSQRAIIHQEWEDLRQVCLDEGTTYEKQLQLERFGGIKETISMAYAYAKKAMNGYETADNEFRSHLEISRLLGLWNLHEGAVGDLAGLMKFLSSPHYAAAPAIDISAALIARLITGNKSINHGDAMDVDHISSILPYVNLMIVDKRMRNLVRQLSLDIKYNTLVCFTGDTDEIDNFFIQTETAKVRSS